MGTINVFNVKDYGALGNGSHVDTGNINTAIAALKTAGGGVLYFPKGDYIMNDGSSLDGSVPMMLQGDGECSRVFYGTGNGGCVFSLGRYLQQNYRIKVKDICIFRPNSGTSYGFQLNSTSVLFENVVINGQTRGIVNGDSYSCAFSDVQFVNCSQYGYHSDSSTFSNDIYFLRPKFLGGACIPFYIELPGLGFHVDGGDFENLTSGKIMKVLAGTGGGKNFAASWSFTRNYSEVIPGAVFDFAGAIQGFKHDCNTYSTCPNLNIPNISGGSCDSNTLSSCGILTNIPTTGCTNFTPTNTTVIP